MDVQTIPQMLRQVFLTYPKYVAQYYKNENKDILPITYEELYNRVLTFASGLMSNDIRRGEKIGVIMDNRPEWMVCVLGLQTAGCLDVPRGTDSTVPELVHILSLTECRVVIAETKRALDKIIQAAEECPHLQTIITINPTEKLPETNLKIISYDDIMKTGAADFEKNAPDKEILKGNREDVSTIIFTSGTTGLPKGVMLRHKNFLAQLPELAKIILIRPGATGLFVLPIWHSFERECELLCISRGTALFYSAPLASVLMPDLQKVDPIVFPTVPRIWEAIYDAIYKLMKKQGGMRYRIFKMAVAVSTTWKRQQLKLMGRWIQVKKSEQFTQPLLALLPTIFLAPLNLLFDALVFRKIRVKMGKTFKYCGGVSGGAALPYNIDMFFAACNIPVVEGYGMTETAPVIACRDMKRPVFGTVGKPLACLTVKIVDDYGNEVPQGEEGEIWVKGDTVMAGYYRNEAETKATMTDDGWFKTGDIGLMTIHGELVLRGRLKDTIVLRGGENIEPVPIEMKLQESQLIQTAVVVGQDMRNLGALILVDDVTLKQWLAEQGITYSNFEDVLKTPAVQNLYATEIRTLVSAKNGFKSFEVVGKFHLLAKKFEKGVELSVKEEVMRKKIDTLYENEIASMFAEK